MITPITHSCTSARIADHISVLPMLMRMSSETSAATATISSATRRPQLSIT